MLISTFDLQCLNPKPIGVNGLWVQLKKIITHFEQNFVATKLKRKRKKTPWINRRIIHLKRRVQRMRMNKKNPILLKELASQLKAEIRSARHAFVTYSIPLYHRPATKKLALLGTA